MKRSSARVGRWDAIACAAGGLCLVVSAGAVADGTLDLSFGAEGKVTTDFPGGENYAVATAIQEDGKLLVLGTVGLHNAIARYDVDGNLDLFFGDAGFVRIDSASDMALQGDGKIVVSGGIDGDSVLARYLDDGVLDPTFGEDGMVATDTVGVLALQSDDKIIVAGSTLARYGASGAIDTSFGVGGIVAAVEPVARVLVQPDGKIVTIGTAGAPDDADFAIARYNVDGSLDDGSVNDLTPSDAFAASGHTTFDFNGEYDAARGAALQTDGKIVVVGTAVEKIVYGDGRYNYRYDMGVLRCNPDGSLDDGGANDSTPGDAFGSAGKLALDFFEQFDAATDVVIDSNERIIVAGEANVTDDFVTTRFALARLQADGSPDPAFGSGTPAAFGRVVTDFPGREGATRVTVLAGAGLLVAGYVRGLDGDLDVGLASYQEDGQLNAAYGTAGTVVSEIPFANDDFARAVAVQGDGKIVVAGGGAVAQGTSDFSVARYDADGVPDAGFGVGGKVSTDFGGRELASGVAIQTDGKIIVAGTADGDFAVARYETDGELDLTFGIGGTVRTNLSGRPGFASAVALQPDGSIVLVGQSDVSAQPGFAVVRYDNSGALDVSFGSGGIVTIDFEENGEAMAVALQPDGKIVVAGEAFYGSGPAYFALARLNVDGTLDDGSPSDTTAGDSFGEDGIVTHAVLGDSDRATAVAIQADGKIVAAGEVAVADPEDPEYFLYSLGAVVRYQEDGTVDRAFGDNGTLILPSSQGFYTDSSALVIQPDAKILVAGRSEATVDESNNFAIMRLDRDGALDPEFATNGVVSTDFSAGADQISAIALGSDGRLFAAGSASIHAGVDFALAAYDVCSGSCLGCGTGTCRDVDGGCKACAQPASSGAEPIASDALAILRTAVTLRKCAPCVCDVTGDGLIFATDALRVLQRAVGNDVALECAGGG
jgi:uncharacterized delta-60 repeat protein